MSWLAALPVALVAAGWVLLPGLAVTYGLGVRGVAAWGAAPVVSIGSIAAGAVLLGALGVPWSPVTALVGPVLAVVVIVSVRIVRRRLGRSEAAPAPPEYRQLIAGAAGLVGATALGSAAAAQGMGTAGTLNQTYDAVFHYSAVTRIVESGEASSLTLGTLTDPSAGLAFYPAAWHDLVSLLIVTISASVPVASNVMAIVVAVLVWPLSCLLLVRQAAGRSVATALATPIVAVGFVAFPWSLMTFGVLWPNLLGVALLPAALAVVVTLCGITRDSTLTRTHAVVLAGFAGPALALAHPSTLFNLAVLAAFPVTWWLGSRVPELVRSGRPFHAVALVAAALTVGGYVLYLIVASPLFDAQREFDWPAYQSPPQAAGEVLLGATNGKAAAWTLAAVVVVGLVAAGRTATAGWVIPAHLASAMLFVVATSLDSDLATALTGLWYNDSYRLAALLPVTGVVAAVLGLCAVGAWAARTVAGTTGPPRTLGPSTLTVAALVLLVVASGGLYVRDHAAFLATAYEDSERSGLVKPVERVFFERVATAVPPDAVVAQNPWTGSAVLWALTGRQVLFPHLDGDWTPDQRYLAEHLTAAADDERVCRIAQRLDVEYLLVGEVSFWPWDERTDEYPGLEEAAQAPGFQLVAADDHGNALFRIRACDPDRVPTATGLPG